MKISGPGEKVILSVEDDDSTEFLLEMGFQEINDNFRLYRARDGEDALAFLSRSGLYADVPRPDLVLLNLNLPKIDGFQVLEAIKNNDVLKTLPVVVFTSSELDRDRARCLASGAHAFFSKPRSMDELFATLQHVCSLV